MPQIAAPDFLPSTCVDSPPRTRSSQPPPPVLLSWDIGMCVCACGLCQPLQASPFVCLFVSRVNETLKFLFPRPLTSALSLSLLVSRPRDSGPARYFPFCVSQTWQPTSLLLSEPGWKSAGLATAPVRLSYQRVTFGRFARGEGGDRWCRVRPVPV